MSCPLRIAPMTLADLEHATEWAATEGWNPGLEDVAAFHRVDPDGFLMGWLGDEPATAISVVRHSDSFGFLGFYLCHPDHRGEGLGWATWQAGMAHLGARTIGLDGVSAQEANYRRSGFELAFRSHRYEGEIAGRAHPGIATAGPGDLSAMQALDTAVGGTSRPTYLGSWFQQTTTRHTFVCRAGDHITGLGTIRACRSGHKIGPLIAPDADTATALLESLVLAADARQIAIDIPETSATGQALVARYDLSSAFACARMYRGTPLDIDPDCLVALATFELG